MLLQILDDGRLTDSQGRVVNFENTIIVMTTNAGASFRSNGLGFNQDRPAVLTDQIRSALKDLFRPEFINRIDEIITFDPLTREDLRKIVDLMLKEVYQAGEYQNISILVNEEAKEYLAANGYDEKFGARPLRRLIQREVEDEIAEAFLRQEIQSGDIIELALVNGKIAIRNKI